MPPLQAHALLLRGRPPPPDDTLRALAALRLQSLHQDFSPRGPLPRLDRLLPPPTPPREQSLRPTPRPQPSAALLAGALWSPGLAKRRAERARGGCTGCSTGSTAQVGGGGASRTTAVLGSWKRLRGMGQAEAMAAYLALAAQCPGFGAARYDVLELSTVRGRREKGTLVVQAPTPLPQRHRPSFPHQGHFIPAAHLKPLDSPIWARTSRCSWPLHTCAVNQGSRVKEAPRSQPSPPTRNEDTEAPPSALTPPISLQEPGGGAPQKLCLGLGAKAMSLSRPGETEPIHSVSYGHVAACQLIGPHTLALRVGDSQLLLQSPQVRTGGLEEKTGICAAIDFRTLGMVKSKLKELAFDLRSQMINKDLKTKR